MAPGYRILKGQHQVNLGQMAPGSPGLVKISIIQIAWASNGTRAPLCSFSFATHCVRSSAGWSGHTNIRMNKFSFDSFVARLSGLRGG